MSKRPVKERILAQGRKEWEGFNPVTGYRLGQVADLPVTRLKRAADGKKEGEPTSVKEVLRTFEGRHVALKWLPPFPLEIAAADDEMAVEGPQFHLQMLAAELALRNEGAGGSSSTWYWYNRDTGGVPRFHDHSFFVVHSGRIVREQVVFTDSAQDSGFDPAVFVPEAGDEVIGEVVADELEWINARSLFWRRKFHKETYIGQVMALRNDRPDLWVYRNESRYAEAALHLLSSVQRSLWVLIGLLVLLVIRLWR
jgi:hypothetical protein